MVPSANIQTLLGSANFAAARSNLGLVIGVPFMSGNVEATLADGEVIYFGAPQTGFTPASGSGATRQLYLPAGKIVGIKGLGFPSNAGVSNENATLAVRKNNTSDDVVTTTFAFSASAFGQTIFENTSLNTDVVQGDYVEIKVTAPTYATNPTNVSFWGTLFIKLQ